MSKKLKIEKTAKRQKWHLLDCAEDVFDKDMIAGPHIELFSNSKIVLDGCLGVFEYKDTYIKLRLPKGAVILCGSDLQIVFFENRLITVKGTISSVEFCI